MIMIRRIVLLSLKLGIPISQCDMSPISCVGAKKVECVLW